MKKFVPMQARETVGGVRLNKNFIAISWRHLPEAVPMRRTPLKAPTFFY
jgi:hypothetical protein